MYTYLRKNVALWCRATNNNFPRTFYPYYPYVYIALSFHYNVRVVYPLECTFFSTFRRSPFNHFNRRIDGKIVFVLPINVRTMVRCWFQFYKTSPPTFCYFNANDWACDKNSLLVECIMQVLYCYCTRRECLELLKNLYIFTKVQQRRRLFVQKKCEINAKHVVSWFF